MDVSYNYKITKGWYNVVLQATKNGVSTTLTSMSFGVGDVFIIAGQSNARGVPNKYFEYVNKTDNVVSYHWESNQEHKPVGIRILQASRPTWSGDAIAFNQYEYWGNILKRSRLENGLPHFRKFVRMDYKTNSFKKPKRTTASGNETLEIIQFNDYEQFIYPYGGASWAYMPLGKLWISGQGCPILFFNFARNDSSIEKWQREYTPIGDETDFENYFTVLKKFINFQGRYHGFRGILWYQGERDITNETTTATYKTKLENLMNHMRVETALDMTWFISKVSYSTTDGSDNPKSSVNIANAQSTATINSSSKKFIGVDDAVSGLNIQSTRAVEFNIHFTGSSLQTLGQAWYTAITNSIVMSNTKIVTPVGLFPTEVTYNASNNTYTLTAPTGYNEWRWVKDEGDIEKSINYSSGRTKPVSATGKLDREVYTGFMKQSSWKAWAMCAPFIVPNQKDKEFSLFTPSGTTVSGNSNNGSFRVDAAGVTWNSSVIYNQGSGWLSTSGSTSGGAGYYDLNFNVSSNTSGSPRTAKIRVVGQNALGSTITSDFLLIQESGSGGGCSNTALTTLTPTNSSSEWSPWSGSQFNGKNYTSNTMQVSGVQYSQGIGTHASSRIVYNLSGGGYTTFTGLVGRDDQADNEYDAGKIVFSIKTNGSTVWTSSVHGNTTGAQSFSVNVSGKSTLELLVSESSDGVSYDHANWMNVYLSCSGGGSCTNAAPTGVSASPSSFSSGGGTSNLTATCAAGATVVWNGSVGSGSPKTVTTTSTTTYTAKCVSASCGDSPSVPVTVNVSTSGGGTGCSAITNNLVMGTWTVTGHQLIAKQFHGQWWLVQRINTSPEAFLVRGSSMLTRGDVNLTSGTYSGLVDCFAWKYSSYGGLQVPSSSDFATPSGYTLGYESDGTAYYTASGAPPSGCTNAYLTNSWTYASAGYNPPPKIGQSVVGGNMELGSTNYTSSYPGTGIGTHATSEIIYDLGTSHGYQYFKATVGKNEGSMCGDNRLVFKVMNNAGNVLLATSPTIGNPAYGFPNQADMSVSLSGVRYLKLVVEDGGDGVGCDHANWARARLTCTSSGRISARDSLTPLFTIYPNVNNGEFTVEVDLETEGDYTVDLINSSGAVYKQEKHSGKKGQNPIQFKAGNIQSGLYLLRVTTKDRLETKAVVIEK